MKKYSIGIDLGGTKILIGLVEKESGKVVSHIKKKTKKEKGPENIVRKMVEGVEELLEESGKSFTEISSIGIGSAGQIDRKNGIIIGAPNLDCYNLNLKEILQDKFNIPVFVGKNEQLERSFALANGIKREFITIINNGKFSPLKVTNPSVFAYSESYNGQNLVVIGNLNFRNNSDVVVKVPKLNTKSMVTPVRVDSIPITQKGSIKNHSKTRRNTSFAS